MVNLADCVGTEQSPSAHTDNFIFRVENRSLEPYQVAIKINGKQVIMEIDTGAALSIILDSHTSLCFYRNPQITKVRTYMTKEIPELGQLTVDVKYGNYKELGRGPCLLGEIGCST